MAFKTKRFSLRPSSACLLGMSAEGWAQEICICQCLHLGSLTNTLEGVRVGEKTAIPPLSWISFTASIRSRLGPSWLKLPREKPFNNIFEYEPHALRTGELVRPFSSQQHYNFIFQTGRIMDAVRIQDGDIVDIKEVATWKEEIPIALYLSSDAVRLADPRSALCQYSTFRRSQTLMNRLWLLCPCFLPSTTFRFGV